MRKLLLLSLVSITIAGCAGDKGDLLETPRTMREIYENAYTEFNDGNYDVAATEFLDAETSFPSSPYAGDALIMAAYSQYLDKDFAGAILALDRFMRFHPGSDHVAYVLYLRGMCYYRQVSDVRRDPGMSSYALQQFEQLTQRFPNSEYTKNVQNKILILKNYIAGKIMYSARLDMAQENWPSAITQLQSVVDGAQETVMTPEALYRLTECYAAIGLPQQVAGYSEMLRTNFPENEWCEKLDKKTEDFEPVSAE